MNKPELTAQEIQDALTIAYQQIIHFMDTYPHAFQSTFSKNGFYATMDNVDWTNGFWTGEIWLLYEFSHDERLLKAAQEQVINFKKRIEEKISVDHHDLGFLYSPSCVAAYLITNDNSAKAAALLAADQLISRYHEKGEFIQAWGNVNEPKHYRYIIDCLMNVPLLYWAYEETGKQAYKEIADKHVHTTMTYSIRQDFSTWHTFFFNPETGQPSHGETCQGYENNSAWTRGQAWAIYGTALSYKHTKDERYIALFQHLLDYYLKRLPEDLVPYWDLMFTSGSEPKDSSSAVIVSCGLLEMAKYVPDANYLSFAKKIMKSVVDHYAVKDKSLSNGLILHGTYSNKTPYNTCNHAGVDECTSFGDYFYLEALTRLSKDWHPYW